MPPKSECVSIQTSTLRWLFGGIGTVLVFLAGLIWTTAINYQENKQNNESTQRMMSMHHEAIKVISKAQPPEVRQAVSDIFFNAAQAGEKTP